MRLLLVFISIFFSFIFYVFYLFSIGKDIFLKTLDLTYVINSFSPNLLYETILFLLIACVFYLYFMTFSKKENKENIEKEKILIKNNFFINIASILVISFFFIVFYLLLINLITNKILLIHLLGLMFNIFLFFFIVKINFFGKYKKIIKIISILLLYLSSICGIYFLFNNNINYIVLLILSYSVIFNIEIHYKYTNYISLTFGLIVFFFLIFFLFGYK